MQQLQEEIKQDIIKHAARNIEIIYEPGKTAMTKQDEQLLAAYIQLHDFELKMQKTVDKLYHDFIPVNKIIDTLREELMKVQATFNDCCSLADKLSDTSYIFGETSLEKLTESQVLTGKEILNYNDKIIKAYETIEGLSKEVNKYNEANEDEANALYDEYSKICTAHSINWENNAINIVTFEDEYARFLNYRTVHEDRRTSLMNFCDSALNNYTNLNLQTNSLYNVWKEFIKRCNLLRTLAELHAKVLGINNN